MNTEQKIASEGNDGNRRSSRLKVTIGIYYEGDDDGSINENKNSSKFDTAEGKKSSTVTPEKKPETENYFDNFV